jgi:hypothetical protein
MNIRLRDLSQGALLHVVVALLAGPMRAEQIARKTGKSPDTVRRTLATLDSEFGLVTSVSDGRWPIWSLRNTSQLELELANRPDPDPVDNAPAAVDNSAELTPQISGSTCSSSSFDSNLDISSKLLLPATPQISGSSAGDLLISQLTRMGATPGQAIKAINAALKRRETTPLISQRIARLAQYAADHRTIRNPGQWALGYIASGCDLPADLHTVEPDYSGYRPYLATNTEDAEPDS